MVSGAVIAIVCLPAVLTVVWFLEVLAGCVAVRRPTVSPLVRLSAPSHRTTVLVPAHNEGRGILPTIHDTQAQLGPRDSILVVADNCTDDTAAIAKSAGVEVVVRADPVRRGKGYALEFGVRHLRLDPPDVVVIMDADCRLGENALRYMSEQAMANGRPVQSLYLMLAPESAPPGKGVNLFTWRVRNWIRPLGLGLLGLPTQLFGTGMAFPFGLLKDRDLGNNRLAEDCALGIALASTGHPPLFVSEARVHSHFPVSQAGSDSQRQRWEKGHLENIIDLVPGALARSLRDRNFGLAALAIDMAVPPLSLLVLVTVLCAVLGGAAWILGASPAALAIPLLSVLLVGFGTGLAWTTVGRDVLPLRELLRLPLHAIRKLGFYHGIASGKASSSWIRTDRK
ncbi:glycosyltransferase family 2 protein [Bradyrhizobium sp. McL0615]|uniref:glycosyltransferase family 2 protein n=1 Tax=Bradyrhizobium sp. McL0615 TaxID=3415673 RepID=UPI003CFB09F1